MQQNQFWAVDWFRDACCYVSAAKNDSEAYMVWKERESSWTWFRRKGFGTVCECFTSALCAGPHLLYAEQQVLVSLLRLRGRGGVAALHLHRTTCSVK